MLPRAQWHPSLTDDRLLDAAQSQITDLEDPGFCLSCGTEASQVEPDARALRCEACNERQVYGAEWLLTIMAC